MYGYDSYDYGSAANAVGGLLLGGVVMWIIGMAVGIFLIISIWKLFTKAGKPGWAAIVPIYNMIVMIEIAELPMWYIALLFVPFANVYAMFKIYIEIAHKFGKSTGFGVGMVFLSPIMIPILAFGKAEYKGGVSASVNTNVSENPNMLNNNVQVNQPITNTNTNIPNVNSQSDIMNVNNNIGNTSMMDVNMVNNVNSFQPVGNVNNNVADSINVNTTNQPVMPSGQEVNVIPSNNNVNTTNQPVMPSGQEVNIIPSNNVVEPIVNNVTNTTEVQSVPNVPIMPDVSMNNIVPTGIVVEPINNTVVNNPTVNTAINDMKKTCPNCGNQVEFNALFCTNCGNNL